MRNLVRNGSDQEVPDTKPLSKEQQTKKENQEKSTPVQMISFSRRGYNVRQIIFRVHAKMMTEHSYVLFSVNNE